VRRAVAQDDVVRRAREAALEAERT
jgi:hypothetical protein